MDRLPKKSKDVKKLSKGKETKECETSEQRAKRYTPFKAIAIGGLLATAGMIGVESRPLQETESRLLEQKNVTRPKFDPSRVSPEFLDHPKKVGVSDPERLIQKVLRQNTRRTLSERRRLEPVDYDHVCLDVSASQAPGSVISSLPDTGLPGSMERVDYYLNVKNNCPVPVDNVQYGVVLRDTCSPSASPASESRPYTFSANPVSIGVGENSGMLGPQNSIAGCTNYVDGVPTSMEPPQSLVISVVARGLVPGATSGTADTVSSVGVEFPVI